MIKDPQTKEAMKAAIQKLVPSVQVTIGAITQGTSTSRRLSSGNVKLKAAYTLLVPEGLETPVTAESATAAMKETSFATELAKQVTAKVEGVTVTANDLALEV